MKRGKVEYILARLFSFLLSYKAVVAVLQLTSGILLLSISHSNISSLVTHLTQPELNEDPRDFIAQYINHLGASFSLGAQVFLGIYLIVHGIIKLGLVYGMWKKKLLIYPISAIFFLLFVGYQLVRFTFTHSFLLLVISAIDLIYVWLIVHEYSVLRNRN